MKPTMSIIETIHIFKIVLATLIVSALVAGCGGGGGSRTSTSITETGIAPDSPDAEGSVETVTESFTYLHPIQKCRNIANSESNCLGYRTVTETITVREQRFSITKCLRDDCQKEIVSEQGRVTHYKYTFAKGCTPMPRFPPEYTFDRTDCTLDLGADTMYDGTHTVTVAASEDSTITSGGMFISARRKHQVLFSRNYVFQVSTIVSTTDSVQGTPIQSSFSLFGAIMIPIASVKLSTSSISLETDIASINTLKLSTIQYTISRRVATSSSSMDSFLYFTSGSVSLSTGTANYPLISTNIAFVDVDYTYRTVLSVLRNSTEMRTTSTESFLVSPHEITNATTTDNTLTWDHISDATHYVIRVVDSSSSTTTTQTTNTFNITGTGIISIGIKACNAGTFSEEVCTKESLSEISN